MFDFSKNIKNAFTLMEIGLSLLIISLLVVVCIPIITNQVKKTDEYAYYMAFKTVEKMGGQILAYGDSQADLNSSSTSHNTPATAITRISNSYYKKFINNLIPSANADIQTSTLVSFPSYEYDYIRKCLGNPSFSDAENNAVQAQEHCKKYLSNDALMVYQRFMCKNMNNRAQEAMQIIATSSMNTSQYCNWLAQVCASAYPCNSDKKSCYKTVEYNSGSPYGECLITVNDPDLNYTAPSLGNYTDDISYTDSAIDCSRYGLINMDGYTSSMPMSCSCDATHPVKALNNRNVCCPTPAQSDKYPYYSSNTHSCVNCKLGAFNESTQSCCPNNSVYSSALGKCVCSEGYTPNDVDNPTACSTSGDDCPAGSHLSDGICVTNAPVIKAKRFCELIKYNWNVTSSNCNTFTTGSGSVSYNANLFSAITANNTPYLSVSAVKGAFNNIGPNIVLANGQRIWILGDKSASIAGLSFPLNNYEPKINTCLHKPSVSENNCVNGTNYYCKSDSMCFSIDNGNPTEGFPTVKDSRGCCSSADISDIVKLYIGNDYIREPRAYAISGFTVFVDINGTKDNDEVGGGGTLWKDVFPFYISAKGPAYPAYPLNALKKGKDSNTDSSSLYQGGNSSALSADVYYYDIVNGKRKKIVVYPSIPYARALCLSTEVSAYTPYCLNLGTKFKHGRENMDKFIRSDSNKCFKHKCFVKLKNKIKYL